MPIEHVLLDAMTGGSDSGSIPLYVAGSALGAVSAALVYQTKRLWEVSKRLEKLHDEDRAWLAKRAEELHELDSSSPHQGGAKAKANAERHERAG